MALHLLSALAGLLAGAPGPAGPVFEADVLPILERRCAECHGISKQSGGLRLDAFEGVAKGGKHGPIVVPGKSGASPIIERITDEGKRRMPPKGDRVPAAEVEAVRRWIDAGARSSPRAGRKEEEIHLQKLPPGVAPVLAVAGDRDGRLVAVGRGASVVVTLLPALLPGEAPPAKPAAPAAPPAAGAAPPAGGAPAAREEIVLEAGPDLVQSLCFSPDGRLLAAGGFREVLLWETASFRLVRRLGPHADRVLALAFSRDGNLLAAGGGLPTQSGEVRIWEAGTGKLFRTLSDLHTDTVFAVDFGPDASMIATASADRMVHVTETASGRRLARFEGHTHHVLGVAFSPDGKRLVSAGADSKLKSWDLEKGEAIRDWNGHGKPVTAVAYAPDGKLAASTSGDRTVRVWNPENGGQVRALGEAKDYLYALSIFGGGKLLAAGGRDPAVRIYDLREGKLLRTLEPPPLP